MPRAKKSEDQPWLKYIVLPLLLILFGLETSYVFLSRTKLSSPKNEAPITAVLTPTPSPSPTPTSKYICPKTSWVDCLPGPGPRKTQCTPDYLKWAKTNCPDFQGAAY